jgi:hypothetical protein
VGQVVHRALAGGRVGGGRSDDLLVEQVADAAVERDHRAQVGHLAGAAQLEDRRGEALLDDDRPGRRAAQQVGELAGAQPPVQRDHDRARRRDADLDLDVLQAVGAQDGDAVELLDAQADQAVGDAPADRAQVAVRAGSVLVDDRGLLEVEAVALDQVGQRERVPPRRPCTTSSSGSHVGEHGIRFPRRPLALAPVDPAHQSINRARS